MVFINRNNCNTGQLPTFICRGVITYIKKEDGIYYILLVDHGISITLTRNEFFVISQDFIPDKYLSKMVGVYNILPTRVKRNVSKDSNNSTATVE